MAKRRVVVTGMGAISPLGHNVQETWDNVLAGKSGISLAEELPEGEFNTRIWAKVKDFNPGDFLPVKEAKRMDPFTQYGMAATKEALDDAGLLDENGKLSNASPYRTGVAAGAGIGGIQTITQSILKMESHGPKKVSPFFIPSAIINMLPGHISIKHNLKGPNISVVTACTTGAHNIGLAARMIAYNDADVMVCGGAEMTTTPVCIAGFSAARSLSKRNDEPTRASRPFDKDRDGFVMGEGAGILVLEEYEHAKKRGATIYAELAGYGMTGDAYHITSPDENGEGAGMAMQLAIDDAGIAKEDVDYINAHGTSTMLNDKFETLAIKNVFAEHAYQLAVSSTKSMTGHLLGAAGAIEAIFSILAIQHNCIPPTINLDNPDEDCDLDYVPHQARETKVNVALSNSLGFGGTNGSLLFKSIDDEC